MTGMGAPGEQEARQEDPMASPTTPRQSRPSAAELVRAKNPRASSPAKRPAATLEESQGAKVQEAMDVDRLSPLRKSFDNRAMTQSTGDGERTRDNTFQTSIRAASVDMLEETQSDPQRGRQTESHAMFMSDDSPVCPDDASSGSPHISTGRDYEGIQKGPIRSATAPSLDEQVLRIHKMYHQHKEEEGAKGFVLSSAWYKRVVAKTAEGQKSGDYSKADMEADIGPVDNSGLVEEFVDQQNIEDERDEPFVPLKPGLLQRQDLEIIPENAWHQIVQWHGLKDNSPVIIRYMHDTAPQGSSTQNLMFELYPPIFTIQKLSNETQSFAGLRDPAREASLLVASQNERVQNFLIRVKRSVQVDMKIKVQVWRLLESTGAGTVEVSNSGAGILTPASSRNPSPTPGLSQSVTPVPKALIDPVTFSNMLEGSERELVDIQDQTTNEKYNGHVQLETVGLGTSQTLIIEEQIGGPGGGEFISDTSRNKSKKNAMSSRNKNPGLLLNSRTKGMESGRSSPAPTGPVTRGRTRRSARTRGTLGLVNLGNTCYMNSALQCVRSIEELSVYFLAEKYKEELNTNNPLGHRGEIAKTYSSFVHSLYGESTGAFTPRVLKNTIGRCQPLFSGYGQQDSQEFLSFLLDAIHEDLNRVQKKPYMENPESDDNTVNDPEAVKALGEKFRQNHQARNDSVAMDLFSGFYKNTMVCPECDKVSITFDPYSLVTLQLPVQSSWQHNVVFAPLSDKPLQIQVDIDKNSTIKALKEYVAKKIDGFDPKKCVVAETYNRKFFKIFDDDRAAVESIQTNDVIVIYELDDVPSNFPPPESKQRKAYLGYSYNNSPPTDDEVGEESPLAERMLVPLFHRLPSNANSRNSGKSTCQWPSFVLITRDEAKDHDEIFRKVLAKVATMTTRPILTEEEDTFGIISASNSGSEVVLNTDEDTSSLSGQKIKDQSVASEDGIVDVSMTDNGDSTMEAAGNADTVMGRVDKKTKPLPGVLQHGTFIPVHLQTIFKMKYFRSGADLVPTGWNTLVETKEYPTIESRITTEQISRQPLIRSRSSIRSNHDEERSSSSSDDLDNAPPSIDNNPGFSNDPGSDSDDLPPDRALLNKRRSGGSKKRASKMKTYGSKGKRVQNAITSFDGAADSHATEGMLIKPHEGIVLDWNPDAYDSLFMGSSNDELRGNSTWDVMDTLQDPELDTKKAKRAARKKHGVTLDECFSETARSEILSEENAWYCNRCKEMRLASKTLEIWTIPDILVLHLKRFSAHRGFRDKVDVLVDFPVEGLDLSGRVGLPEGKGLMYDLFAVDNHYGGLGGGHYTAYAQNFYDRKWYEYNDSVVSPCGNPQSVVTSAAYLLFYRRRSSTYLGGTFLSDLVHSVRSAESEDSGDAGPSNESCGASPAGDGQFLASAGRSGAMVEMNTTVGGGVRGGLSGSSGGGLAGIEKTGGEWDEDEGVKMDDDEDHSRNLPQFGPAMPGSFNSVIPGWDFSNLSSNKDAAETDDGGVVDMNRDLDDGVASDRVAADSELGEELGHRMLEDFGDEATHPGFGTPVQRDLDEEMMDTPGIAGGIMMVRAVSEEVEDAPVAEVKLDGEDG
ncbi:MAG: CSN-associated deubiquitinating enzyme Ubp12 [Bathelium mastoideum]|nr:MAG: CSN-associated deubiquitinating enzyme Ubp12 [Bathelium mastoideum]